MKDELHKKLGFVEALATGSKVSRFLNAPFRYAFAIFQKQVINKYIKATACRQATTFFDRSMAVVLPAATDIYLTGGKTHSSELRLSQFMINQLQSGDTFIDVGAHFGFYSLLAETITGTSGKVYAFEPSPSTYEILKTNTQDISTIHISDSAISDGNAKRSFYEFPMSFSEYNTVYVDQFKNEKWFLTNSPKTVEINSISLDEFIKNENIKASLIKIDVEGAELDVVKGLQIYLTSHAPIVVMEYLSDQRMNTAHVQASQLLHSLGYRSFKITAEGKLDEIVDIGGHLREAELDSDNIVYKKRAC